MVNILIGFIRTKIIAILLGTTGVGLIGMYQTIIDMIKSIAVLGLDSSGIRDIATANSTGNKKMINESVAILKKWMTSLAVLAALICILFAYPIALWAFDGEETSTQTFAVAALSISVLFIMFGISRTVILQGMRKIPEMVKSNIWGNLIALLASIPLYYFWGTKGIVPSLILGSIIMFISISYFSKKIGVENVSIPFKYAYKKGRNMFKMGIFIVSASISETASMFILRSFISHQSGIEEVGIFMAAWTITNVYLALVLRSMGADFYPRLCAVASSNIRIRRLVNEQTHVILIVASPIIVGMLLVADYIIPLLYTSSFVEASELLRWQVFATFLKVISWPMGFILLAKGKGMMHFLTNLFFFFIYLGIGFSLYPVSGLKGIGIGYFVAYVFYLLSLMIITKYTSNFKWRKNILRLETIYFIFIAAAFWLANMENTFVWGVLILVVTSILSIYKMNTIISLKSLKKYFIRK